MFTAQQQWKAPGKQKNRGRHQTSYDTSYIRDVYTRVATRADGGGQRCRVGCLTPRRLRSYFVDTSTRMYVLVLAMSLKNGIICGGHTLRLVLLHRDPDRGNYISYAVHHTWEVYSSSTAVPRMYGEPARHSPCRPAIAVRYDRSKTREIEATDAACCLKTIKYRFFFVFCKWRARRTYVRTYSSRFAPTPFASVTRPDPQTCTRT